MDPLVAAVLAVAAAVMRNGSTAPFDAVVYALLFWVWFAAAAATLIV